MNRRPEALRTDGLFSSLDLWTEHAWKGMTKMDPKTQEEKNCSTLAQVLVLLLLLLYTTT